MKRILLLLLANLALPDALQAQVFDNGGAAQQRLSDAELAALRGGFELPGGLVVNLGVTTDTRIDGQLVLRTVFTANSAAPTLRVYGQEGGQPTELNLGAGTVETEAGTVRLRDLPAGARVDLAGRGIDVSHIVGQAFGSAVANSGSDRAIDAVTTVDLTLSHVTPDQVGSSLFQVEGAALDATRLLIR